MIAAFDTGQYGTLYTSARNRDRLVAQGALRPTKRGDGPFDVTSVALAGEAVADINHLEVEVGRFAAAAPIGITEPDILSIGYGLLRRYKTVWDYRTKELYLLAR